MMNARSVATTAARSQSERSQSERAAVEAYIAVGDAPQVGACHPLPASSVRVYFAEGCVEGCGSN